MGDRTLVKESHRSTKRIHLRDHFSTTYQAASALVLNGKITINNLEEAKKIYDQKIINFVEILLEESQ